MHATFSTSSRRERSSHARNHDLSQGSLFRYRLFRGGTPRSTSKGLTGTASGTLCYASYLGDVYSADNKQLPRNLYRCSGRGEPPASGQTDFYRGSVERDADGAVGRRVSSGGALSERSMAAALRDCPVSP